MVVAQAREPLPHPNTWGVTNRGRVLERPRPSNPAQGSQLLLPLHACLFSHTSYVANDRGNNNKNKQNRRFSLIVLTRQLATSGNHLAVHVVAGHIAITLSSSSVPVF